MTDLQKIQSRLGAVRIRLSEIAGAELTDETRGELETLRTEYVDLEKRADAMRMAGDASPDQPTITETSEGREYGQLITRANLGEIFDASFTHKPLTGATGELQTHLGMDLNQVPLALLTRQHPEDGRLETRAVTPAPADVGTNQMATLMYVFPMSAASFLGVNQPTVGVGEQLFPIMTNAPAVGTPAENDAQAETTGAFSTETLAPRRLQASYFYSMEDRSRFAGMAESLRESLSMGLSDGLDNQILTGANGFFSATNLANHNVTTATDFDLYMSQFAYSRVDGRYASSASEVKTVMGATSYAHAGSVYRNASVDRNALERLQEVTGGVRVSSHVPAAASNRQNAVMRVGMNGQAAVAPIWDGIQLIPDNITKAASGQIVITAIMLWNFKIIRTADFFKQQIQTA